MNRNHRLDRRWYHPVADRAVLQSGPKLPAEFPGFRPPLAAKFDQIFVGIDNVQRTDTARLQVKILTKVFTLTQDGVFVFFTSDGINEISGHAFSGVFQFVISFNAQSLIDTLTVTRLMAAFVQRIKAGTFWQVKTLGPSWLQ
jgi:hypothetical protein